LGNSTDQTQTFIHAPFITDKKTTSSGAGAIPITGCFHEITTTGADALTLANGVDGQHLYIVMMVDGGVGTLSADEESTETTTQEEVVSKKGSVKKANPTGIKTKTANKRKTSRKKNPLALK